MLGAASPTLTTGVAALSFAAIFLIGQQVHPLRRFARDRRSLISFSAGMSVAYVFVHMLPELNAARELVVESSSDALRLPYEGVTIYFLAMIGFLWSYGLDRLRARRALTTPHEGGDAEPGMHLAGMAAYVALMSYLLVRTASGSVAATVGYTLAFGGHFLALDHSLCEEFENAYLRHGRWLLAGSCLLGWAVGIMLALPPYALALLVAFISGGVIMTNALMELSEGRDGRFVAFMAGSLSYGLVLIPLG